MRRTPQVFNIAPNVYHILDAGWVFCTLIVGRERALLIDTGYGVSDIKSCIASITDKPYDVVNTHGHIDHIAGNNAFPCVYISSREKELLSELLASVSWEKVALSLCCTHGLSEEETNRLQKAGEGLNFRYIDEGRIFDLGGITIEATALPGHSPGSLGFLWQEERLLFAGDALSRDFYFFTPFCSTFPEYRQTLVRALQLPFDRFFTSHSEYPVPKDFLHTAIRNIDNMKHDPRTRGFHSGYVTYWTEYTEGDFTSKITYSEKQLV